MLTLLAGLLLTFPDAPPASEVPPTLTITLIRPQVQGERILALFEGSRAAHPAAALAAVRQAKGGQSGLSKAAEAGIAIFNPRMVSELHLLEGATLRISRSTDGRLLWNATIPFDDGSIAALGTAASLTDGGVEPPLDGANVDRMGEPGSPLIAQGPQGLAIAGNRRELARALAIPRPVAAPRSEPAGLVVRFVPTTLADPSQSLTYQRVAAALSELGVDEVELRGMIENDAIRGVVRTKSQAPFPFGRTPVDPKWLDGIPTERTAAAFALGVDSSPEAWNHAFAWLDRIEKTDPTLKGVAPIRLRASLLARAADMNLEADLFPYLQGLSGFLTVDEKGDLDGGLLRLHLKDEPSAERLRSVTIPKLMNTLQARGLPDRTNEDASYFRVGGIAVGVRRTSSTVAIGIGDRIFSAAREALSDGKKSLGPELRAKLNSGSSTQRFAAVWPGRLRTVDLEQTSPIVWIGGSDEKGTTDTIYWPGLKTTVGLWLDRLPLVPPPDGSTPFTPKTKKSGTP